MQSLHKGPRSILLTSKGGVDYPKVWRRCRMCFTEQDSALHSGAACGGIGIPNKGRLAKQGVLTLTHTTKSTGDGLPRLLFACDEVAEVLDKTGRSKEDKELLAQIENRLSTIARLGRAFGIHLILATQRPDANYHPRSDQEQHGFPGMRQGG